MSSEKERKVRKARRVDLHCTLGFSSGEIEGEAAVLNISPAGCRAETDINLAEGLEVQALIQLPNQSRPITIERASVRWVSGNAFGLSFILMLASERARLRELLEQAK
jgi:PilZ domain